MEDEPQSTSSIINPDGPIGRQEARLIRHAVQQRWKIPDQLYAALPVVLAQIAVNEKKSTRNRVMATRAIVSMHGQNLSVDKNDVDPYDEMPTIEAVVRVLEDRKHANGGNGAAAASNGGNGHGKAGGGGADPVMPRRNGNGHRKPAGPKNGNGKQV